MAVARNKMSIPPPPHQPPETAGHRVSELFKRRGVTAIANDSVVDVGLSALVFGAALCHLGAVYLLLYLVGDVLGMRGWASTTSLVVLFCSYFFVTILAATTVEVLRSSYKAVFVCFVQVGC